MYASVIACHAPGSIFKTQCYCVTLQPPAHHASKDTSAAAAKKTATEFISVVVVRFSNILSARCVSELLHKLTFVLSAVNLDTRTHCMSEFWTRPADGHARTCAS